MSDDTIFLIDGSGKLERVPNTPYASEDMLQQLLEQHPELFSGDQINPDAPPRWMLISREAGIPDQEGGGERWSVDHLLLDQTGRPTFVEVKRASDTRIRREVVGQMLDYAANAKVYWPTDQIKALASETSGGDDRLTERLGELLQLGEADDATTAIETFWANVERNLRAGEVRLLFVADGIPGELRRVIEYLNEHMPAVEVLGVEMRHYEGGNIRALVPRIVGQTEFARQQKQSSGRVRRQISREDFLEQCPHRSAEFFAELLDQATAAEYRISWGKLGFSLRLATREGNLATVFYGSLPYRQGAHEAVLQPHRGAIEDPAEQHAFHQTLSQFLNLELRTQQTLEEAVSEARVDAMTRAIPEILEVPKQVVSGLR
jgi:hypothetical protein